MSSAVSKFLCLETSKLDALVSVKKLGKYLRTFYLYSKIYMEKRSKYKIHYLFVILKPSQGLKLTIMFTKTFSDPKQSYKKWRTSK